MYALFSFNYVAISAETGGMPQLNPEFWFSQIFWLTITFGILFIILSKFILPKIRNNLETRKSQIMENIEIADNQKTKSENNLKEYDKIISNITFPISKYNWIFFTQRKQHISQILDGLYVCISNYHDVK